MGEYEDRSDILMQLSAVIGALQSITKVILKDHLDHCVVDAPAYRYEPCAQINVIVIPCFAASPGTLLSRSGNPGLDSRTRFHGSKFLPIIAFLLSEYSGQ